MKVLGLFGITPKAKYKSYKGDMNGTVKNLLLVKELDEKNHKTTYKEIFLQLHVIKNGQQMYLSFVIAAGKLYLSPILDMYNDEIVSYIISKSPNFKQTTDMLNIAFSKYDNLKDLIFHSDQGWQYQMEAYHKALKEHDIISVHVKKRKLFGQLCNGELLWGKNEE